MNWKNKSKDIKFQSWTTDNDSSEHGDDRDDEVLRALEDDGESNHSLNEITQSKLDPYDTEDDYDSQDGEFENYQAGFGPKVEEVKESIEEDNNSISSIETEESMETSPVEDITIKVQEYLDTEDNINEKPEIELKSTPIKPVEKDYWMVLKNGFIDINMIENDYGKISSIAIAGEFVYFGTQQSKIIKKSMYTQSLIQKLDIKPDSAISSLVVSDAEDFMVIGHVSGTVYVYDITTLQNLKLIKQVKDVFKGVKIEQILLLKQKFAFLVSFGSTVVKIIIRKRLFIYTVEVVPLFSKSFSQVRHMKKMPEPIHYNPLKQSTNLIEIHQNYDIIGIVTDVCILLVKIAAEGNREHHVLAKIPIADPKLIQNNTFDSSIKYAAQIDWYPLDGSGEFMLRPRLVLVNEGQVVTYELSRGRNTPIDFSSKNDITIRESSIITKVCKNAVYTKWINAYEVFIIDNSYEGIIFHPLYDLEPSPTSKYQRGYVSVRSNLKLEIRTIQNYELMSKRSRECIKYNASILTNEGYIYVLYPHHFNHLHIMQLLERMKFFVQNNNYKTAINLNIDGIESQPAFKTQFSNQMKETLLQYIKHSEDMQTLVGCADVIKIAKTIHQIPVILDALYDLYIERGVFDKKEKNEAQLLEVLTYVLSKNIVTRIPNVRYYYLLFKTYQYKMKEIEHLLLKIDNSELHEDPNHVQDWLKLSISKFLNLKLYIKIHNDHVKLTSNLQSYFKSKDSQKIEKCLRARFITPLVELESMMANSEKVQQELFNYWAHGLAGIKYFNEELIKKDNRYLFEDKLPNNLFKNSNIHPIDENIFSVQSIFVCHLFSSDPKETNVIQHYLKHSPKLLTKILHFLIYLSFTPILTPPLQIHNPIPIKLSFQFNEDPYPPSLKSIVFETLLNVKKQPHNDIRRIITILLNHVLYHSLCSRKGSNLNQLYINDTHCYQQIYMIFMYFLKNNYIDFVDLETTSNFIIGFIRIFSVKSQLYYSEEDMETIQRYAIHVLSTLERKMNESDFSEFIKQICKICNKKTLQTIYSQYSTDLTDDMKLVRERLLKSNDHHGVFDFIITISHRVRNKSLQEYTEFTTYICKNQVVKLLSIDTMATASLFINDFNIQNTQVSMSLRSINDDKVRNNFVKALLQYRTNLPTNTIIEFIEENNESVVLIEDFIKRYIEGSSKSISANEMIQIIQKYDHLWNCTTYLLNYVGKTEEAQNLFRMGIESMLEELENDYLTVRPHQLKNPDLDVYLFIRAYKIKFHEGNRIDKQLKYSEEYENFEMVNPQPLPKSLSLKTMEPIISKLNESFMLLNEARRYSPILSRLNSNSSAPDSEAMQLLGQFYLGTLNIFINRVKFLLKTYDHNVFRMKDRPHISKLYIQIDYDKRHDDEEFLLFDDDDDNIEFDSDTDEENEYYIPQPPAVIHEAFKQESQNEKVDFDHLVMIAKENEYLLTNHDHVLGLIQFYGYIMRSIFNVFLHQVPLTYVINKFVGKHTEKPFGFLKENILGCFKDLLFEYHLTTIARQYAFVNSFQLFNDKYAASTQGKKLLHTTKKICMFCLQPIINTFSPFNQRRLPESHIYFDCGHLSHEQCLYFVNSSILKKKEIDDTSECLECLGSASLFAARLAIAPKVTSYKRTLSELYRESLLLERTYNRIVKKQQDWAFKMMVYNRVGAAAINYFIDTGYEKASRSVKLASHPMSTFPFSKVERKMRDSILKDDDETDDSDIISFGEEDELSIPEEWLEKTTNPFLKHQYPSSTSLLSTNALHGLKKDLRKIYYENLNVLDDGDDAMSYISDTPYYLSDYEEEDLSSELLSDDDLSL